MATHGTLDRHRLAAASERATNELLSGRTQAGHWVGELSSSALSTATAVAALATVERATPGKLGIKNSLLGASIARGLEWLAQNANADGSWGDTDQSLGNLSTTALCWAAFGAVPGADEKFRHVVSRAEERLKQQAGGLNPDQLAPAIIARYGKDRTFSVPILTTLALAGRFGPDREAWRWVLPLPFELAACPQEWFARLRLPVVSYALPALIAIGQARHHHSPSRNPFARWLRQLTRRRTLEVLTRIQPASGGFLEATPLTSFVVMSLAGSGQVDHPVTTKGVEFLLQSQRADGSWPIDTNLATWVTTLAVNAIACCQLPITNRTTSRPNDLATGDWRLAVSPWLLGQQYRQVHPYTNSPPGGWAWTDLPGGVPDADDTAGALLALKNLGTADARTREAVIAGTSWLLALQNRDGGIPTFCRGWGTLPFDRSSADLTAHALQAWVAWIKQVPAPLQQRIRNAIAASVKFLFQAQRQDGSWIPLWFGNQFAPGEENQVYGTARVLIGLLAVRDALRCESSSNSSPATIEPNQLNGLLAQGVRWLLAAQNPDGSWGGGKPGQPSVEETALALGALASALVAESKNKMDLLPLVEVKSAVVSGANWLIGRVESGAWKTPSPIGFYFAKLWYYERLYPLIFTAGALGQVWRLCQNEATGLMNDELTNDERSPNGE